MIDLDKSIKYTIEEYSVYGVEINPWKKGNNYSIIKESISEEEKQKILSYYNYESDQLTRLDDWLSSYWKITFKDKTIIKKGVLY